MTDIKTSLPRSVAGLGVVSDILDAISAELNLLELAARDECSQAAANLATKSLAEWERELGLSRRADMDDASRRRLILTALSFFWRCTPQKLAKMLADMLNGEVSVIESAAEYTISLSSHGGKIPSDLPSALKAVAKAAPAHVTCVVSAEGLLSAEMTPRGCLHGHAELNIYS